jgi:hypothetical protein
LRTLPSQGRLCSVRCFEQESSPKTTREVGNYGGVTREVLQHLWTGVASGRPVLLELQQTRPPHGARTYTGGRCSCPPAPTSPKNCSAAASGRSIEYSERTSALQHQGDGGFGGGRGRVHAPNNVTVGKLSWETTLRYTCPHDGVCDRIYHQSVPERSCGRWSKAGNSRNINGPLAVLCFARGDEEIAPIDCSSQFRSPGGGIVHHQRVHCQRRPSDHR